MESRSYQLPGSAQTNCPTCWCWFDLPQAAQPGTSIATYQWSETLGLMSSFSFSRWFLPPKCHKINKNTVKQRAQKTGNTTHVWIWNYCCANSEGTNGTMLHQNYPTISIHFPLFPPGCSNLVAGRSSIIASKLSIGIVDHRLVPESLPCVQQAPMTKQYSKLLEMQVMTSPQFIANTLMHC